MGENEDRFNQHRLELVLKHEWLARSPDDPNPKCRRSFCICLDTPEALLHWVTNLSSQLTLEAYFRHH